MEVVAGSYEEVLIGLCLKQEAIDCQLTETFTEKVIGSVKCVAVSDDGLLASGGTDEIIRIFDLRKHQLVGTLTHHSGTVTSLQFHKTHLFSTSEDGTLCLWRVATWEPERTFKGHKKPVKHVAVHPTGKMTLSLGEDKTLRLWNNMTCRIAYISNLKESAEQVRWSPGGLYYVVAYRTHLEVFSIESKGLHRRIETSQKVNSIVFVSDTVIAYGGECRLRDGRREKATVFFADILEGQCLLEMNTKCDRIRDMAVCQECLTLVGSDGTVSVYQFTFPSQESIKVELLTSHNVSLRLTSVAMFIPQETGKEKTEKPANEGEPVSSPKAAKRKRKRTSETDSGSELVKKKKKKQVKISEPAQRPQKKKDRRKQRRSQ